jgi:hypothetical protein
MSARQRSLFDASRPTVPQLEMHEHTYISGPRANGVFDPKRQKTTSTFSHSHANGSTPHQHPHTGPACYVIDKDDWKRVTGMRGGGRKQYTAAPSGEQLPFVELDDAQKSFKVICVGPPSTNGTGPGVSLPARMVLQFGMKATFEDRS